ncbi:ATP-binding protein [Scleromatobacter humisilvae]|uniref:histidine kinase n=1 Tax=Scleromatobacter humisilvae TaxID=2897159 RepID=A0A9X1YMI9_9BURK|nr:ATP-binding protein [Scleromatobacter humisilvae]MCK9688200.1 ATP-binding protein [Scleromatobacter humisilvae]
MAAPTLFRRLVVAQTIGSLALVLVFGAAFYAERNRTVARLTAERWAPALRAAAGFGGSVPATPTPLEVRVSETRPAGAVPSSRWAPRIVTLRATLREDGVPAGDVVFTHGVPHPVTWIEVAGPDGRTRWLGLQDDVVESYVFRRLFIALALGLAVVSAASWALARRLTRPLEALRRRIESHDAKAAPTISADGAPTLEIAAIETAWVALADRLARQESERALLLGGVSHDLRSPLSRIRMAAELLPDTAEVATRRAAIVRNVDVADRLIASFLDYVRATELPLAATVDIAAVARQLLETRGEPAATLALAAPARLDVPRTHELLLERLLANLVDNAMRHGQPPVLIRLAGDGRDVVVDVEDHGPGIAPEAQARMTQAFARGDASRATPGTGLGLAIVQQIVRRMGGTLSFERVEGAPCVRVRLPAR